MYSYLKNYLRTEEGASMVEYALITALISIVVITVLPGVSDALKGIFNQITTALGGTPR